MDSTKKRGRADTEGPEEEEHSVFILLAKNRALATNLYSYKLKIEQLESQVISLQRNLLTERATTSICSRHMQIVSRHVTFLIHYIVPCLLLALQLQRGLLDAIHSLPSSAVDEAEVRQLHALSETAEAVQSSHHSGVIISNLLEVDAVMADGTFPPTASAAIDESFAKRCAFLARVTQIVVAACQSLGSAGVPPKALAQSDTSSRLQQALHDKIAALRDVIANKASEIIASDARCRQLESDLRRKTRSLERLLFDHPSLRADYELHQKSISAHHVLEPYEASSAHSEIPASAGFVAEPAGNALAPSPIAHLDRDISVASFTSAASGPAPNIISASAVLPVVEGAAASAEISVATASKELLALEKQIEQLTQDLCDQRDETDVYKSLAESQSNDIKDRDSQILMLQTELLRTRQGVMPEAAVLGSKLYIDKCSALEAMEDQLSRSEAETHTARTQLERMRMRATTAEALVAKLMHESTVFDLQLKEAYLQRTHEVERALEEAIAEKDTILRNLERLRAADSLGPGWKARCDAAEKLITSLRFELKQVRSDWLTSLRSDNAIQQLLAEIHSSAPPSADTNISALRLECESLRAERDTLSSMLESVSTGYDTAVDDAATAQGAARELSVAVERLEGDAASFATERAAWLETRAALEAVISDCKASISAHQATIGAHKVLLDSARAELAAKEEKSMSAQRDAARLALVGSPASVSVQSELRQRIQELQRQLEVASQQAAGALRELVDAEASKTKVQEKVVELTKRAEKREEKLQRLKERLAVLEGSHSSPLNVGPSPAAAAAASTAAAAAPVVNGGSETIGTDHYKFVQRAITCSVCSTHSKDTVIVKCGHCFCKSCLDQRLQLRSRKCPHCNQAFGADDLKPIYLTV
jgi:hypothetical protein